MHLDLPGWLVATLALAAVLLLLALGARLRRYGQAVALGRRRRRGAAGEREAVRLLRRCGYTIIADQPTCTVVVLLDGEPQEFTVRADALVEDEDGERLVAEVKTSAAASVSVRATRRQLLEYAHAYGVDGVLLVDVDAGLVHRVEFPLPQPAEMLGSSDGKRQQAGRV
jgi:hypothetical protein